MAAKRIPHAHNRSLRAHGWPQKVLATQGNNRLKTARINYSANPLRSCPSTRTVWGHLMHSRRRTGAIVRPSRGTVRAIFIRAPQRGQTSSRARASSCSPTGALPARTLPAFSARNEIRSAAIRCKRAFNNPGEPGRSGAGGVTENPGTVETPRACPWATRNVASLFGAGHGRLRSPSSSRGLSVSARLDSTSRPPKLGPVDRAYAYGPEFALLLPSPQSHASVLHDRSRVVMYEY
jgi:hypothetical protein